MLLVSPFIVFWILIYLGRDELGFKGVVACALIWIGLSAGFTYLNVPSYYFTAAQALLDAILILLIFGGDIRIR